MISLILQALSYSNADQVSPSSESQSKVYVARYSYDARLDIDGDLSFNKGEQLLVLDQKDDWWFARSLKTQKKGYIPKNYVADTQSYKKEL